MASEKAGKHGALTMGTVQRIYQHNYVFQCLLSVFNPKELCGRRSNIPWDFGCGG